MTTYKQFMDEIERETAEEGPEAMEELDLYRRYFRDLRNNHATVDKEQPCLVEAFFRHEAQKPPHLRKDSCMISCPCPRCSPGMDPQPCR